MTTRDVTIAGFVIVFATAAVLVVMSRLRTDVLARFSTVVSAVTNRHKVLRIALLFAWAWLGWHFLVRTG